MVRQIVTSAAYRQSSFERPELQRVDPGNRLLGRQSRWRIEAEFIRDQALAASGLLVRQIGGDSVRPYQQAGYYAYLNFPKRTYVASTGDDQYRRGVYTHWQRTFLHPTLLAFDAPSREECTAERPRSNTPLAALALLNDPSFVEAARVFAESLLAGSGDDQTRMVSAWRQALSRHPEPRELELLERLLDNQRRIYAADPQSALKLLGIGQHPRDERVDPSELAAWAAVTRAILNLNEAVTRN
ncbi:MAG: DUF1553 domain-containing protein [Planctomycetes bacterium]|nr:DUF1553 domain-containing protein [Planctomycetota bacterium]